MGNNRNDKMKEKIYHDLLCYIDNKQKELKQSPQVDIADVFPLVEKMMYFMENSKALLAKATGYYDPEDITISHSANVAVFTLTIAMDMDLCYDELVTLGAAAIVHDIGAAKIPAEIIQKDTAELTQKEIEYFQKHSELGYNSIDKHDSQLQEIAEIAYQHHERMDGSGYPRALKNGALKQAARIISLIDVYESMIHPRGHRDALVPPHGIENIIADDRGGFDPQVMEALYTNLTIFPENTYVELLSGEIGRVVDINEEYPKRPQVEILFSADGQKIEPQIINLAESPTQRIHNSIPKPVGLD